MFIRIILISLITILFIPHRTFSLEQNNPIINKNGITFFYHNNYAAKVYLKSSFDQWSLKYPFRKNINKIGLWDGWWKLYLPIKFKKFQLKKGSYTYKLIVDNNFISDPKNNNKIEDGMGNYLSSFTIQNDLINYNILNNPSKIKDRANLYRFIYKNHNAKQVYIVGTFNQWNPNSHKLTKINDGIWEIKIKLPIGKFYYNLVVDDRWIKDPLNNNIIRNTIGKAYSYFEVKENN